MGFWDKEDDREPWEEHEEKYPKRNDDEEMFGSSAFKMPMNDFEVKEWEKKLLGNPETILKSSEMGDFVKDVFTYEDAVRTTYALNGWGEPKNIVRKY